MMIYDMDHVSLWQKTKTHMYILPHPLLRKYIAHYTIFTPAMQSSSSTLNLIPDVSGCLILSLQDDVIHASIWGATTTCVQVNNDEKDKKFFVEFLPGGCFHLTGIHQRELQNIKIDLKQVSLKLYLKIQVLYDTSQYLSTFIKKLDCFFLEELQYQQLQKRGSAIILPDLLNVSSMYDIAKENHYSERHINRLFQEQFGTSYKTYQRINRINYILQNMNMETSLLPLIHRVGYFDHAHFNHDFKAICNVSFREYMKKMSFFYNEPFKF